MKAHLKYLNYVLRHKWFVFWYCIEMGVSLRRAIMHDMSKFSPREWFPYVRFFYGNGRTRESLGSYSADTTGEQYFEYAWNHHQKRNDHHWQYWVRFGDDGTIYVLPMSEPALREMVADWRGAGRALGKPNTQAWYNANRLKMTLAPQTREAVEDLLDLCVDPSWATMIGFRPRVLRDGSPASPGGWQFLLHWYASHKARLSLPPELEKVVEGYLDSVDPYRPSA